MGRRKNTTYKNAVRIAYDEANQTDFHFFSPFFFFLFILRYVSNFKRSKLFASKQLKT